GAAPAPPWHADARRGSRDLHLSGYDAGSDVRGASGTAHGPPDAAERGCRPCRDQGPLAGSSQPDGSSRPRSAGLATFRAPESARDRRRAWHQGEGGGDALCAGSPPFEKHPDRSARRAVGDQTMSENESAPDLISNLAHEFAERYRRGERPALSEYTEQHPELATQIRELFPALAMMEQFGSVAGEAPVGNAASSAVPRQLGEYRILREIGRGGMGIVYEAVQESLGRHVALKVLPLHHLLARTHLERFEREAKAAAWLHHTNIVPVFGIGVHDGIHYYAMQFIQGQAVDAVLREVRHMRSGNAKPSHSPLTASIAM